MQSIPRFRFLFVSFLIPLFAGCASSLKTGETTSAMAAGGMVVASHTIAAEIGLDVLKSGGNAVDAAVATGLALGVVDQFNSGIGGGGFIVIRMADGTIYTIDGREKAPAAATRDMYIRNGKFEPDLSRISPLAVGIPGILAAYDKALELAGTMPLAQLISPSIEVAEKGFPLDEYYVLRYNKAIEMLEDDPASAKIYLHPDGSRLKIGDVLKQPDLASTYRKLLEEGQDYFYRGEFAGHLARYMSKNGGLVTKEDMSTYSAIIRDPVVGTYHDCKVIGMAPPSSGGVHIVQILNMLEASGILEATSGWDAQTILRTSQFMRKAFEDRAVHLGDPDFHAVPIGRLISKGYADSCIRTIMDDAPPISDPGNGQNVSFGHTTNICVIDKWGNAVAVNQTVNLTYGAKITLPGTGIILNNEMDDFSAQPGVPNAFHLIGSEANSIAPGKRPLSSMSPTIVVRNGKPILILGGAGGPTIITAVLQIIVDMLDFEQELADAQANPRFHHQFKPDVVVMEKGMSKWVAAWLLFKGQKFVLREELGRINAIAWSEREQAYIGVPDPRGRGAAVGY